MCSVKILESDASRLESTILKEAISESQKRREEKKEIPRREGDPEDKDPFSLFDKLSK